MELSVIGNFHYSDGIELISMLTISLLFFKQSVRNIVNATKQEMGDCPGIVSQKVSKFLRMCKLYIFQFLKGLMNGQKIKK